MKTPEILAIYGACLSTFVFIWNVKRAVPQFKVKLIHGSKHVDGKHQTGIYIFVQNPSGGTVHLSSISLLYPYTTPNIEERIKHLIKYKRLPFRLGWINAFLSIYDIDEGCPKELAAGKSHDVFISDAVLEEIIEGSVRRELIAIVQDQLWRNKYSKKLKLLPPKKSN